MRFRHLMRSATAVALIAFFSFLPLIPSSAALLTGVSDVLSTHEAAMGSDHTVTFTTVTGVDASSDTITLGLVGFSLAGVGVGDVDLTHGPTTGMETAETLAASAAAGVWGVSFSGTTVTFTPPTDAAAGEVASNDRVIIRIGTNATGGVNRITNPSLEGDYELVIDGDFGDDVRVGLAITDPDVVVTADVASTSTAGGGGGGGGGGAGSNPILFNIQTSTTSYTTLLVTWQTDEQATSIVDYGHDITYASGTVEDITFTGTHQITINGLIPCKTYHLRARSRDVDGNTGMSADYTVTMPCDLTPPVITNVQAVNVTDTSARIQWSTDEPADSLVEYGLTPTYGSTGTIAGFVTGHSIPLSGLLPNTIYHFRVRSIDPWGNVAWSGDYTFTTSRDTTAPANPALTAVPGDRQVTLSWTLPPDPDFVGVRIVRRTDRFPLSPGDGVIVYEGRATSIIDEPLTNGVTYYYGAYAYDSYGNFSSGALASATPFGPGTPPVVIPPGTTPLPPGTIPAGPGVTTTPPTPGATMTLYLFGAGGALPLVRGADGMVGMLSGGSVVARVPADSLNGTPSLVAITVAGNTYQLVLDERQNAYVARWTAPVPVGRYEALAQAVLTDGRIVQFVVVLRVQPRGRIFERTLLGAETPIEGARVRLIRLEGRERIVWDGSSTGQQNPLTTGTDGSYAFEVPPGRYLVEVEKDGYWSYFGAPIFTDGNVFAIPVELIRAPVPPESVITPDANFIERAVALIQHLADLLVAWIKWLRQFLGSALVTGFIRDTLIPLLLVLALLNAVSSIPLFGTLALLQYALLSLWFLLTRKRGPEDPAIVYDAFTKRPMDLVVLRLLHAPTGLTVFLRVTDRQGRYWFRAEPGSYRLEATKPGYAFPSALFRRQKDDGTRKDAYTGERIVLEEAGWISRNTPMDPLVPEETNRQIILRESLRRLQHGVAAGGVAVGVVALVLVPSVAVIAVVALQAGIYALFRRLVLPMKGTRKAIIRDAQTRKPISGAVVRLVEASTGKPIDAQLSDRQGRYGFAASGNVFEVTVEHPRYQATTIRIDLTRSEDSSLAKAIYLERKA